MTTSKFLATLFVIVWATTPAAQAGLFSDDEAHRKIAELQRQLAEARVQNATLEQRVAALENAMRGQGTELLSQVETLKNEVRRLNGLVETNTFNIDSTQKRQKDLYVDLDTRMRLLEKPVESAPPLDQPALNPMPGTLPPVAPTRGGRTGKASPQNEGKAYDAAFQLFKSGNYAGAISAFNEFLAAYPGSTYAANAQYWIGNALYAQRDYAGAIAAQRRLLSAYPTSPKASEALFNIASSQQEMGDMNGARKTLEDLVAKYPLSPAADLAKKRLSYLR